MADEPAESPRKVEPNRDGGVTERIDYHMEQFVHVVELAAAAIFALLFAIGVADLGFRIGEVVLSGRIARPRVVIGFIDTGLLLLVIVEVYQTVVAYIRRPETRYIVRLLIYTGIIAMVRKVIIIRTGDYATTETALFAALAYTIILLALGGLLLVERVFEE